MLSIEKACNGFIVREEEGETRVYQAEFNSVNVALAAVIKDLIEKMADDEEIRIKVDFGP
jgi:uncharacterized lipoprotein YajG